MTPAARQLVELLARAVARELAAGATDGTKNARGRDGARGRGHEQEQKNAITKFAQFNTR
jgi:hypothetical protein